MNNWTAEAWRTVVESAPEGIVICDATAPDCPVVFVNAAFAQLCGYPAAALLGSNLRMLQGTDREQEGRNRLHEAIAKGEPARVLLRNYRPDGSLFWNETLIQPLRERFRRAHAFHRLPPRCQRAAQGAGARAGGPAVLAARGSPDGL